MGRFTLTTALLATMLGLVLVPGINPVHAQGTQPYAVREFAASRDPELVEQRPVISGSLVVWGEAKAPRKLHGRRLPDGEPFTFGTLFPYTTYDVSGDNMVTVEISDQGYGVYQYRMTDFARREIAPPNGTDLGRPEVRIAGDMVAWLEGSLRAGRWDIYAHDLRTGRTWPVCTNPAQQDNLALSDKFVVWRDSRHSPEDKSSVWDLYAYDLAAERESRVTAWSAVIGHLALSGDTVVCETKAQRGAGSNYRLASLVAYNLASGRRRTLVEFEAAPVPTWVDMEGDLVVWSAYLVGDQDIYGYDMQLGEPFAICSAIGEQSRPRVAGRNVVWLDTRHRPLGEGAWNGNIYGATLQPGAAPPPPVTGAPAGTSCWGK